MFDFMKRKMLLIYDKINFDINYTYYKTQYGKFLYKLKEKLKIYDDERLNVIFYLILYGKNIAKKTKNVLSMLGSGINSTITNIFSNSEDNRKETINKFIKLYEMNSSNNGDRYIMKLTDNINKYINLNIKNILNKNELYKFVMTNIRDENIFI